MRSWFIPMIYVVLSIAASMTLPRVEHYYLAGLPSRVSISSAQSFLSAASSGMMALTGIIFSFAFVIIQFSGAAYSPRLVSWFARDPLLFHALGMFIATFVYALATLSWIERGVQNYVPILSTYIVLALLIGSMVFLALIVQRVGELQIGNVFRLVGAQGRKVIDALPATVAQDTPANGAAAAGGPSAPSRLIRYTGIPKAVNAVDIDRLADVAERAQAVISLCCAVGDTLTYGSMLCTIDGDRQSISEREVLRALVLNDERTPFRDPKYSIRILVDIAIRALSPAVNDPTTAIQALDQIEDLLCRLAGRSLTDGCMAERNGVLRAFLPSASWEDYLMLGFDEIRLCGANSLQVMRRLNEALVTIERAAPYASRAEAARRYRKHLDSGVDHSQFDTEDRASALRSDRQGLGLSR